uniref:esterase-like activity of phytase family protein n=1 Tax=uncultured Erythrobacter sp. TaxID=263913 RepID=UPI00260D8F2B|nr:esterase-like activity of phytase family protein [uncultured Erythrobacter sp.]
MTVFSTLLASSAFALASPAQESAQEQSAADPQAEAAQTPIIVEGDTDKPEIRAQLGSRIAKEPLFTDLSVASSTGIAGLTPGSGLQPLHGANAIRKKVTSTCVSDNEEVGARASCLLIKAREAGAKDDQLLEADIYRYLASSEEFGAQERLTGGTELYNLGERSGNELLREEALIRLLDAEVLEEARRPDARRTLVDMAIARGDNALAIERLSQHAAMPDPDAQSLANLAILKREAGQSDAAPYMTRAIAARQAEGGEVPQGWLDFAPASSAAEKPCQRDFGMSVLTEPVPLDPSDAAKEDIGELSYRGGIVIEPGDEKIGGISSLEWHDGALYAVTDDGRWLSITLDELDGRLLDVIGIDSGPLSNMKGKRLKGKDEADSEALARADDGSWLVAFEHDHRIWRYTALDSRAQPTELPIVDLVFDAQPNGGLESLAQSPAGLIACGEWSGSDVMNCMRERDGGLVPFEISPPAALVGRGAVPTDADCASDGTCYILFRSYSPQLGNASAIVAIDAANKAKTIASFLPPVTLDNFEGLTVREELDRTYIYIASDDNFSKRQRNLLMKFEVMSARKDIVLPPPPSSEVDTATYETVTVILETSMGDITVALETERAPITASNFLRYADEDRFDGTVFYRTMRLDRDPRPNGLIQGGTQFDPKRILDGIEHEPTSQTGLSHTSGALSMAMGEPGTANGDFSIMLQDQVGLDAQPKSDDPIWKNGYAVFGYVTEGMDVVTAIHAAQTDPNKGEGMMRGQMIADPIKIIDVRRAPVPGQASTE